MTEQEYRKLKRDSYSGLKTFNNKKRDYYKEIVLGHRRENKNFDMMFGSLVDCLLLDEESFDDKFSLSSFIKPKGQLGELVDSLLSYTAIYTNEEGMVTEAFSTIFEYAVKDVQDKGKYKNGKIEKILADFNSGGLEYYSEARKVINKDVIDISVLEWANKGVEFLRNHKNSRHYLFNEDCEILTQFPILFEYRGVEMKSLFDIFMINHEEKWAQPVDLKVTYLSDEFDIAYLKNSYYIQNGVYTVAARAYLDANGMEDYFLKDMDFLTCNNGFIDAPLVWNTTSQDLYKAMHGFITKGRRYKGVDEIIDELKYAKENDVWNMSMTAHMNNGQNSLGIIYEEI